MEIDIALAPAGYMFMYLSAMALFAWNFLRILRNRSRQVRIEAHDKAGSNDEHQVSHTYADSRRAA